MTTITVYMKHMHAVLVCDDPQRLHGALFPVPTRHRQIIGDTLAVFPAWWALDCIGALARANHHFDVITVGFHGYTRKDTYLAPRWFRPGHKDLTTSSYWHRAASYNQPATQLGGVA